MPYSMYHYKKAPVGVCRTNPSKLYYISKIDSDLVKVEPNRMETIKIQLPIFRLKSC